MSARAATWWRDAMHREPDDVSSPPDGESCPLLLTPEELRGRLDEMAPTALRSAKELHEEIIAAYERDMRAETRAWRRRGIAEALAVARRYSSESLEMLATECRRHCSQLRHTFWIVVACAQRLGGLASLLTSVERALTQFGHPRSAVRVLVVLDGDTSSEQARRAVSQAACALEVHVLGQEEASSVLADRGVHRGPEGLQAFGAPGVARRSALATANVAKLALRHLFEVNGPALIWHMDADQTLGAAVRGSPLVRRHVGPVFDYFACVDALFLEDDDRVLSGKLTGDPPFSPSVATGTLLDDLQAALRRGERQGEQAIPTAAYDNDSYPYYDIGVLERLRASARPAAYPFLAHDDDAGRASTFSGLSFHFWGVHPTRPILYHPRARHLCPRTGIDRRVERTDIVNPGNVVYTPASLRRPYPLGGLGLRMGGPALGAQLADERPDGCVRAFLPMLHDRRLGAVPGSRLGVRANALGPDVTEEYRRQMLGDLALLLVRRGVDGRGAVSPILVRRHAESTTVELAAVYDAHRASVLAGVASSRAALEAATRRPDERDVVEAFLGAVERNFATTDARCTLGGEDARRVVRAVEAIPAVTHAWERWIR